MYYIIYAAAIQENKFSLKSLTETVQ